MAKIKLSSFSAAFHEYELDLDYYHGKDILHTGCLLRLDKTYSWEKISSKIRNKIRKAQKLQVQIERVEGTPEDIKNFRKIWFDPEDPTIPERLATDEIMYLAYQDGLLTAGLILTPSSETVLYMHNLGANSLGKKDNIPALLLWHAVEELEASQYEYIDVGVSFRPALYKFFKNWKTDSYPIIFNPPFIMPGIHLTPFKAGDITVYENDADGAVQSLLREHFGETFTLLPRAIYCIKAVLQHLDIKNDENVAIFKTFENDYITRCVTDTIESRCQVSRVIDDKTRAVLVIHEFGYPCTQTVALKEQCIERGIPLIEDCAWTCGGFIDPEHKVGEVGDYAIFSLPKVFPVQYGGILKGLAIDDDDNWQNFKLLDYFKREAVYTGLYEGLPQLGAINEKRRENWHYLASLFAKDGYRPLNDLPDGASPGAFVIKLPASQENFERYGRFGIETGRYYQEDALFLPVHQNLGVNELNYIYGVFRGQLNLSSSYRRDIKK
jgi:hypothetical protein